MIIPKLIHQIHFGTRDYILPFEGNIQEIKKLNPNYSYKLWNEDEANELILTRFSEYYSYYKNLSLIEKSDFFRYILMYFYGGIYFDLDVQLHKSLDEFFSYNKINYRTLRGVTVLPERGTVENLNFYKYDVILNSENYIHNGETYVNNFCILSRPNHILWKRLLDVITLNNSGSVYEKTGYKILTKTLSEFSDKKDILVLPPFYFGWADFYETHRPSWVIASHRSNKNRILSESRILYRTDELPEVSDIDYSDINIGLAITTFNRPDMLLKTIKAYKKYNRNIQNGRYIVWDDGSDKENADLNRKYALEHKFEYFYSEENIGVAKSKNKCFELLEDSDFIFLSDDDSYPLYHDWWDVFIDTYHKTKIPHFCVTFSHFADGRYSGHHLQPIKNVNGCELDVYGTACGILMFYAKPILNRIGGMDINYLKWGGEHVGHSSRIVNSEFGQRLTGIPCPKNAFNLFRSHDYEQNANSKIEKEYREWSAKVYERLLHSERHDDSFKPFKKDNYILSSYITQVPDAQRHVHWKDDDFSIMESWYESIKKHDLTAIVLHDNLSKEFINRYSNKNVKFYRVKNDKQHDPSSFRWIQYKDFLDRYGYYIDSVFFTDISDVEVLKNPFEQELFKERNNEYVFSGDELIKLNCPWMDEKRLGFSKFLEGYGEFYRKYSDEKLLNAGLFGGKLEKVNPLVKKMAEISDSVRYNNFNSDMPIFNFVLRTSGFPIIHGAPMNTGFKKYENDNTTCWFKHK